MIEWSKEEAIICPIAHLTMVALALIIYLFFRKKSPEQKRVPLYCLSVLFLFLEVYKQINAMLTGYDTWDIPLHFCSFFIFWPLLSMFGKGKVKKFGEVITFVWSFAIVIFMLINPGSVYGGSVNDLYYNHHIDHSFAFHELIILYFVLDFLMNITSLKLKNIKFVPIALVGYAIIAIPFAFALNTNYCAILSAKAIPMFEDLRLQIGQPLYVIGLIAVGFAFLLACYLILYSINKLFHRKKSRK